MSRSRPAATRPAARCAPVLLALLAFVVLVAPEIGRMVDFRHFETFDPNGPGLGNLFGQISPVEALGIWPSGDFRLSPGDGAVPPLGYYLGAAFAALLLLYGLVLCWRRRELALLSGLAAVAGVYAIAHHSGTPYTAAKAVVIAAPGRGRGDRRAAPAPPGGRPLHAGRRRLRAARLRQRPGRPDLLLAGAHRAAAADRLRLDPGARPAAPAR